MTDYSIWRDLHGIPHIEASKQTDMYRGQGFVHGKDRGMQILFMRLLGQGRLSEFLDSSAASLKIDMFFRRMNWSGNTETEKHKLSEDASTKINAYCQGLNDAFNKALPWELRLLGYKHEPWTVDDSLLISRMVGYLTLAQSQGEIERLVLEMIQAGVTDEKLEALFPGLLTGLDRELINKVQLEEPIVSKEILWDAGVPRMMASNNWVISGSKTKSGKPILSNDPHLEVNRLPNVWCEMAISCGKQWALGSTMPGLPGILIGRNKQLSWGATYAFVDTIDSWIERCDKGSYFREQSDENQQGWQSFKIRKEVILRKNKAAETVQFYENELGTLEGDPNEQEHCLITRWAAAESGSAAVEAVMDIFNASTVDQGRDAYGKIETGWNYVFADIDGDIGFQMSGLVPIRNNGLSGLIPTAAWKAENHWQGFIAIKDMPRVKNPESGFFCTANEDLNEYGNASPINMPMGSYRSDRISQLLAKSCDFTIEAITKMHFDVYSLQAEKFMMILKPLLPDTPQGKALSDWDLNYDRESKGAFLFEHFYKALYQEVFGQRGLGEDVVKMLQEDTGTFIDFYANFDRILLAETSVWFEGLSRDELFQKVALDSLDIEIKPWKTKQQYLMKNILFDGKLPAFLGFDKGPFTAIGGRATIHQGQIYKSGGRDTTFLPSYRMVTDFANNDLHTNLAGGPSDRRFSKWYCNDLDNWLKGKYKVLNCETGQEKLKF